MNRTPTFILIALLACQVLSFAQNADMRRAFEEFSKASRQNYGAFSEEATSKFVKALQENWEKFNLYDAAIKKRKTSVDTLRAGTVFPDAQIDLKDVPEECADANKPVALSTDAFFDFNKTSTQNARPVSFDYFGRTCKLDVPSGYGSLHPLSRSEYFVGRFWNDLSSCDAMSFFASCKKTACDLKLNDWALFKWVQRLSEVVYPENINDEQSIFTVFCLNQLGLRAKIARIEGGLVALFAAQQVVYGRKYAVISDIKYYLPDASSSAGQLSTYSVDISSSLKSMDMSMPQHPAIGAETDTLVGVRSKVLDTEVVVRMKYDNIHFYEDYPQLDVKHYAQADPDSDFAESLMDTMKKNLNGLSGVEAVNILLHFVQNDFRYRTDSNQFGREKPYFCEENFVYPYNDCEDRVVLFTYLVRSILGYKCMLLDYEDHINCAINIPGATSGYYVLRGDAKYCICDPTYIGSSAGQSPKDYRMKPRRVVVL